MRLTKSLLVSFAATLVLSSVAQAAPTNLLEKILKWTPYGNVEISSDQQKVTIQEKGEENIHAYKDMAVEEGVTGNFALFISYTWAERLHPVLPDGNINITGRPTLHGYFMKDDVNIAAYLQGQNMLHTAKGDGEWRVSYGIFKIPSETKKIRFFLQQASRQGVEQDGRAATFFKPGLFMVSSEGEAEVMIKRYWDELPSGTGQKPVETSVSVAPPEKSPVIFSVFPKDQKFRVFFEKTAVKKVKSLERKLNILVTALEGEVQEKAKNIVDEWRKQAHLMLQEGFGALKSGNREYAFEIFHKLNIHLKEGRLLIRHLAKLIEESEESEDGIEIGDIVLPQFDLGAVEKELNLMKQSYAFLAEELPKLVEKINEANRALAKQYVEEWLTVARRLLDKAHVALKEGNAKEASSMIKAFAEQVRIGRNLFHKLLNLADLQTEVKPEPKKEPPFFLSPPTAFKKADPEKLKQLFGEPTIPSFDSDVAPLETRIIVLEKKLREVLTTVAKQYRDEMTKHVEQWVSVANNTLEDVRRALKDGNKEKAYGLQKALLAHLETGEQLLKKLENLMEEKTVEQSFSILPVGGLVKFPVSVNCYPNCPGYYDKMLSDAYVNKYSVKPVTTTHYEGVLTETQKTGSDGSPTTFEIKPGEFFAFVAFVDKGRALAETKRVFTVPPWKHFGSLKASPESPVCQIRFTDTETPLILQMTGLPSCALSVSIPAQDKNQYLDYIGWLPIRPKMNTYVESEKKVESTPSPVFSREKIEASLLQAEQRFNQIEDALWQIVKLLPENVRPDGEKRTTELSRVAREVRDDARTALGNGQLEKTNGLIVAFETHIKTGQTLIAKLKALLEAK